MSQLLVNGADYIFTELPQSREWFRLIKGVSSVLDEFVPEWSCRETLAPIAELAKGIDGFYYTKKAIENIDTVVSSGKSLYQAPSTTSLFQLFNATVKFAGNTLASFKWFGLLGGVVVLSPYTKAFGYVKNICSVYSASLVIMTNIRTMLSDPDKIQANDIQQSVKHSTPQSKLESIAQIVVAICALWLNGVGGLSSYLGRSAFIERGLPYPKSWTFSGAAILGSAIGIVTQIAKR